MIRTPPRPAVDPNDTRPSHRPAGAHRYAAVVIAALGYFVDVYDLILFSMVRIASLKDLGVAAEDLFDVGAMVLNAQMVGMLVGGLIWGVIGDKKGRLSVLFGSILLSSLANLANGLVPPSVLANAAIRFVAGVGLAGELGAGVSLVSEALPASSRGYGTTIVAVSGVFGGVTAALVGDAVAWRTAYVIGGGLGIALLALRISVRESGMFTALRHEGVRRGDVRHLVTPRRGMRLLACVLVGVPTWNVLGVLVTFAPEFGEALGTRGVPSGGRAVL